ncbi:hypothetical protein BJY16_001795 [Actinoplanes octamycinicus]|uniref:Uncharacterized protein n=1 Tax=Actinoplanes octamycinicus TaxID=135948 RepID=A0A7W7GU46_9ACTN|nr:hypothetical protein [Actinoplanes octamycinicus]MBB4738336.1 hypothetical protein [Actinoplanes octamycinicus]GIE57453.1 hypothetical protein Aoc01nite_28550 [Actinoplanes octamycinicus]
MTSTADGAATPLTRFGSRVPSIPVRAATPTPAPAVTLKPAATINTMIIVLPDELRTDMFTRTSDLSRHFGVAGRLHPRFWAIRNLRLWQHRQLIGMQPRKRNTPVYCAGGPAALLDLDGLRDASGCGAGIRHQLWHQVVQGTRPAQPWPALHARHCADPKKYPYAQARDDFWAQPRVNAMQLHNAATAGTAHLPIEDLEMLQAGPMAYQHYSAMTAICGDALRTADGRVLTPASDTLADRTYYLDQAVRYLDTIENARLIAVTLHH